jgi:hypothetical protein
MDTTAYMNYWYLYSTSRREIPKDSSHFRYEITFTVIHSTESRVQNWWKTTSDDERKKERWSGKWNCQLLRAYKVRINVFFSPSSRHISQFSLLRKLLHRLREIKKETETKLCWWKDEKTRHDVKYITEEETKKLGISCTLQQQQRL